MTARRRDYPKTMTDDHKRVIKRNMDRIAESLTVNDPFLNRLVAHEIITTEEHESLRHETVSSAKATSLVLLLLKKEDRAFDVLVQLCQENNMDALVKILTDDGNCAI